MVSLENPIWPDPIAAALSVGSEEGAGWHNIGACLQIPSIEFEHIPTTELGVPLFSRMSEEQKAGFIRLCGLSDG